MPTALLERRLIKSKEKVEELQKEKADMEKKLAQFLESDKRRKEEEAKAVNISKLVENASPGQVVQMGRQVISYLLPDFQNCNILFATEGEGLCENNTESPSRSPITYHIHSFSFIELLNRGRCSALWKWRPLRHGGRWFRAR